MTPITHALLLSTALCCSATLLMPAPVLAAEAALEGVAWQQADLAYRSYQKGRYRDALSQVNAALQLRPEVARLNLLKVYTLQKLGRAGEARQAAQAALKRGVEDPGLRAAVTNLQSTPGAASGAAPSAAYQRAFPLATKAYAAYNAGDMPGAARDAAQALRIDPSQGPWALLWLDALEAQQKWAEAERAAGTAIALGAPNANDLDARRQTLKRRMAVRPAEQAYQALIGNRPGEAVPLAAEAVHLAPDIASHRLLLVTALLLDQQPGAAEQAASAALEQDDESTVMWVMRGYLRQLQGNSDAARADFDQALSQDWLDEEQLRNVRLIAIDAAVVRADKTRADELLASMDAADAAVLKRRAAVKNARKPSTALTLASYPAPQQSCQDTPYGTQCELLPADSAIGPAGPATEAYAAYARADYPEAIRQARLAVAQAPDSVEMQRLLTTALAAGDSRQAAEAEQRLSDAIARAPNDANLLMQRGYLRQRTGQPARAREDFRAARRTRNAPPTAILDEAYATSAMGDNPGAVRQLKHAIDMDDAGTLKLDAAQRYNTRNAIAGLDREWGATAAMGFRGSRPTTTVAGAGLSTSGDAVFSTNELYWRPTQLNNRHGMLEVYGRLTNTLYDEGGKFESQNVIDPCSGASSSDNRSKDERTNGASSVTGVPSTIGSLGVRYMLSDTGFTVGLERRFFLGSATREGTVYPASRDDQCVIQQRIQAANASNDPDINGLLTRYKLGGSAGGWLSYITYGFYQGTELRRDETSWFTMEGYAQLGYAWEDNAARFSAYDVNGSKPTRELAESNGRLKRQQTFVSSELRVGRSVRLDALSPNLVVYPYLVGAVDWIRQKDRASDLNFAQTDLIDLSGIDAWSLTRDASTWSMGAGPGVNLRYWFREDHYNTPRSYLDWSMQYRFAIGGGATERAKGLFMNLTLSY
ncbi:hypothetical protein DCO48_10665 [Pseudomonas sp. SDI]|uniref:NfrA family protein n=1 Tax=Pseudomonas sp. SDI TaxID=2170734 RepID=UPI000DE6CCF9|nr:hypothetical protein [Pseudomonas sp. SDI]PWB33118.1 hypothetical protein DCO48_10665 [Pseudomonas sp. SDI]